MSLHQLIIENKLNEFKKKLVESMKNYQYYNFDIIYEILDKKLNTITAKKAYETYINIVQLDKLNYNQQNVFLSHQKTDLPPNKNQNPKYNTTQHNIRVRVDDPKLAEILSQTMKYSIR